MSREKQIEELATEIFSLFRSDTMSRALARRLYDKGWRKQREGEWIERRNWAGSIEYKCTACKETTFRAQYYAFCPNCGAKMKGGAE